MSELYSILRKADSNPLPTRFKRVQVNNSAQSVKAGLLNSLLGGLRGDQVWFVQPDTPCKLEPRVFELSETAFDDTARINVTLEVEIPDEKHCEAVGGLTDKKVDPVLTIVDTYRRKVQKWFRYETKHGPGLYAIERVARNRRKLMELAEEVGQELSIDLTVQIGIDHNIFDPLSDEPILKDLHIVVPEFNISLSDRLSHEALLALDLLLRRDGHVSAQPPADEDAWRNWIRDRVRQEARRITTANDYYGDSDKLGKHFEGIINNILKPFGRAVRKIDARAKSRLPVPPEKTIDLDLNWVGRPSGHQITFKVSATMKVDPDCHQVFIARGAPAYESWLQEHAKRALDAHLVAADFVDLTPDYVPSLQANLEKTLAEVAKKDGMLIHPFVATPQVPEIVRTRTARFNTGKKKYQTRDGSFEVWLEISAVGKFESLRHVTSLLQTEGMLEERMATITTNAAEQVLRGAYADRYVLRFDPSIDVEGQKIPHPSKDGKPPNYLADAIRGKVKTELKKNLELLCELDDIQLVQRDDKVAALINMIFELRSFQSEVKVEPVDRKGVANQLPISVTYQVQTVNPNSILVVLRQEYSKEQLHKDIRQEIDRWTKQVLSTVTHEVLTDKTKRKVLRDQLDEMVREQSTLFFGTEVKAISIDVAPSLVDMLELKKAELIHHVEDADIEHDMDNIHNPDYRAELRKRLEKQSDYSDDSAHAAPRPSYPPPTLPKWIGSDTLPADDITSENNQPRQDGGLL